MVIELRGVEFVNKGAELMLLAVRKEILIRIPDAILVMEKTTRAPISKQRKLGIYTKMNFQRFKIDWSKWGKIIPKKIRRKFYFVLDEEVKIILDASGFAYGDQWSLKSVDNRIASKIDLWKKNNKKVILLPQAFGPFENPDLKKMMENIIEKSDLIFAREKKSFSYLKEVLDKDNIRYAPDFTNILEGTVPKQKSKLGDVAIIPNYKMINYFGEDIYNKFIKNTIEILIKKDFTPFFLIHEGNKDLKIAENINLTLNKPIEIIDPRDSLLIKGIISSTKFIVSSRFHGVVSALSQGVPCIITSWSHKYELLAEEYNVSRFVIQDLNDKGKLIDLIDDLRNFDKLEKIKNIILYKSSVFKKQTYNMWDLVFSKIG